MRIKRKLSALALTAVMLLSAVPVPAVTASAAGSLPERYDSRDHGYITPVKYQTYGTCWAHAAIAACEASLIKNNGFSADLDLSELHLAYSATHQQRDRLGLFDGKLEALPCSETLNGNTPETTAITIANLNGVVLDDFHYKQFSHDKFNNAGLHRMVVSNKDLICAANVAQLSDYYLVPSDDTETVKEYIMRYGGGYLSAYTGESSRGDGVFYHDANNEETEGPHAMCVVGWDDTIPAGQLTAGGFTPAHDGAYIVKNSWGREYGVGGYVYIPYENVFSNKKRAFPRKCGSNSLRSAG